MPKAQFIDPAKVRAKGEVTFSPIPVNAYDKNVKEELDAKNFTKEDLVRIYRDMVVIREFETMLHAVKTTGGYNGVEYNNPGPAHLSAGQEAAAVGMAYTLTLDDYIFGSHRSHGEILAKGLRSIEQLSDAELDKIMNDFWNGATVNVVKKNFSGSTKELAIRFLLYGALAEIFARETGFNKGLGGSMHTFFTPFGIYPNNAIVGGSGSIAVGAALYKKVNRKKGLVIANLGDASMACGPVWEGLTFAAMDQFTQLWEGDMKGGLPFVLNIMNNQYGMGGQTCGETMGYEVAARIGAGVNPQQMHAERVDGYNPLAVIDAYRRKKELIEKGEGPVLLDVLTYRYSGHSPSDASSYRTKEEMELWEANDCIVAYGKELIEAGIAKQDDLDAIWKEIKDTMFDTFKLAIDDELSPRMDLKKNPELLGTMTFSNESIDSFSDATPEVNHPMEENPRVKQIAGKVRFVTDKEGKPVSKMKQYQLRDGIFEALIDRFYKDASLVAYGEENRDWGGAFAVYRGLTEALPYHRLFNSPIAEASIVGTAIGYAMCGGRVVPEIMYCDFLGRCGDEVFNQLPKWQAMSGNLLKMPIVLRVSVGSKYGAQHSQDWTSLVAHIPGLKVVFPVTPYDAKGLMNAALQGSDPVVFFESQRIYEIGEMFHEGGVPEGYYEIPFGEPDVKRAGKDITILTIGATLYRALDAAKELEEKYGMSAEIIDARSLVPFNYEPVLESLKKTGRIVIASDASTRGSFLNDLARNITELGFDYLDAPPVVVGSRNWITPAYELEDAFFPQPSWIIDAIHEKIVPLKGHVPTSNFTDAEQIRRAKAGI
ncbi:2-oxoisovalerate dehydrogenase E1 component [Parabacteroides sp. PFB2-12]|uniref:alpha-ketoacid dehydrogenase subunit alpha/beta n=1 Tax=unclassified Parabacteroides TaxID=2649774 RepID=UPI0024746779|nr:MULTISPECIES: alpha-ketoacid dehydrogenase subunit alpha/beta [unclassified Parabacteroides]MDH6341400.1 2-oxoisovalerate dehydrogenase E1 component [Parabacteroides sp. PM6-13]MDH6389194.1 2-oxoisovalerate dehydrogenase E1 component [Parabacteroides sp. PFB2-12]